MDVVYDVYGCCSSFLRYVNMLSGVRDALTNSERLEYTRSAQDLSVICGRHPSHLLFFLMQGATIVVRAHWHPSVGHFPKHHGA